MGDILSNFTRTGDGSGPFTLDSYGRMTYDGADGVGVEYNHMDHPHKVISGSTTLVNYSYLSVGNRASALNDSLGGLLYRGTSNTGVYIHSSDRLGRKI